MSLRSTGSVLMAFLWSLTVVLGQDDWGVTYSTQRICVLKGSTVELSCTYKYPSGHKVTSIFWFTEKDYVNVLDDPDYRGRVTYRSDEKNRHTLIITDLRETDSTKYGFGFITDQPGGKWIGQTGVALSFPGFQLEVTGGDKKTLTCRHCPPLSNPNPTYIWYKNGQQTDESSSPQYKDPVSRNNGDSYSCSVKGHEDLHSPTVCVQGQDCSRVIYNQRRICVLKGSSVNIFCTFVANYYVTSSLWFSPKQSGRWRDKLIPEDLTTDPGYAGRVEYPDQESSRYRGPFTLRITGLREEDSAEYRFTFKTYNFEWGHSLPGTTLTVTVVQVDVSPKEWSESKKLTCRTTCPLTGNPTYIWYKNGQQIDESSSPQYKDPVSSNSVDSYSCSVKGHEDLHSPTVCVRGQFCNRVIYTKRRICLLKGSSVDISCTYVGNHTVTSSLWFSPKQSGRWRDKLIPEDLTTDPGYAGRVEYPDQESRRYRGPFTLRITDLREEDSAEYHFTFKTSNYEWGHSFPGTNLTVTDLQVKLSPATVTEGQNVTLTCITSCPLTDNPTYIWYKKTVTSPKASGQSYSITNIRSEDSREYYCEIENKYGRHKSTTVFIDVQYGPKNPSVSVSPSGEILEGSSVTLTCSSDANPPVYGYAWYKKTVTSPKASGQSYSITNITSEDSGEYYCEVWNRRGSETSSPLMVIVTGKQTSVLTASVGITVVVLVLILCLSGFIWFRKKKASESTCSEKRDNEENGQSVHPDPNSDMYTALNMRNRSPEYDTLESVHPDTNSDMYSSLNMKTRSPDYDTLVSMKHPVTH
uniref:B-cell receptor CD22 n=1 Tax=Esox lucius TaxID=8010 RepID=A0A6Q2ZPJ3_ESOLU